MSLGLVTRASSGWRRVFGIADLGRGLGGAVSLGLVTRAWYGWRRVIGIGEQGVVWVAPCHADW